MTTREEATGLIRFGLCLMLVFLGMGGNDRSFAQQDAATTMADYESTMMETTLAEEAESTIEYPVIPEFEDPQRAIFDIYPDEASYVTEDDMNDTIEYPDEAISLIEEYADDTVDYADDGSVEALTAEELASVEAIFSGEVIFEDYPDEADGETYEVAYASDDELAAADKIETLNKRLESLRAQLKTAEETYASNETIIKSGTEKVAEIDERLKSNLLKAERDSLTRLRYAISKRVSRLTESNGRLKYGIRTFEETIEEIEIEIATLRGNTTVEYYQDDSDLIVDYPAEPVDDYPSDEVV